MQFKSIIMAIGFSAITVSTAPTKANVQALSLASLDTLPNVNATTKTALTNRITTGTACYEGECPAYFNPTECADVWLRPFYQEFLGLCCYDDKDPSWCGKTCNKNGIAINC